MIKELVGGITFNKVISNLTEQGKQSQNWSKSSRTSNTLKGQYSINNIRKRYEKAVAHLQRQVKQGKIYDLVVEETETNYNITYKIRRK